MRRFRPNTDRRGEHGAAMVEFAIILPLLIIVVFGIIEFGRAYNTKITLTHAAREGVREYVLSQSSADAQTVAENAAVGLDIAQLTFSTPAACNSGNVGSPSTVRLEYPFQLAIPFFSSSPMTLIGEGTMRCGG